ncbi:MAG: glycosyltransferase family 39 protein [Chthoniobacterales bacterium]
MSQPTAATLEVITAGPIALPPQRRLMIFFMLALAALLHVATCGWGPINNGSDGMNAAIARELALGLRPAQISQLWNQPVQAGPVQWITAESFQIFNVNELAARLPFAIANLLVVALVFLIAERIGGFWRALSSGIIAATMSGTILHGRDGGGSALTVLWLTLSFYAAVRMLEQKSRPQWHLLYWCSAGGLLALGQPAAAILSIASVWAPFAFFREARIRLRLPWWITCNLLFLAVLILFFHSHWIVLPTWAPANAGRVFWMLFPWSIVMLPPFFCRIRKVLRLKELTPAESVLWCLFVLGTSWVLLFSKPDEWPASSACLGPIFALLSSIIWERTSSRIRMLGVGLLIVLAIMGLGFCGRIAGREWLNLLQPIWWLSLGVIIVFCISAMVALFYRHSRAALLTIAASTIPLAFNLLDAKARYDWQRTMKDFGKKVEVGYMPSSRIFLADQLPAASSFLFYAPHGLSLHTIQSKSEIAASPSNYLIVRRSDATNWPNARKLGGNVTHVLFVLGER